MLQPGLLRECNRAETRCHSKGLKCSHTFCSRTTKICDRRRKQRWSVNGAPEFPFRNERRGAAAVRHHRLVRPRLIYYNHWLASERARISLRFGWKQNASKWSCATYSQLIGSATKQQINSVNPLLLTRQRAMSGIFRRSVGVVWQPSFLDLCVLRIRVALIVIQRLPVRLLKSGICHLPKVISYSYPTKPCIIQRTAR